MGVGVYEGKECVSRSRLLERVRMDKKKMKKTEQLTTIVKGKKSAGDTRHGCLYRIDEAGRIERR